MFAQQMKPETIRHRLAERVVERKRSKAERITRLAALVKTHGPDSIWAELLELEHAA
jgi:hypothetical protein